MPARFVTLMNPSRRRTIRAARRVRRNPSVRRAVTRARRTTRRAVRRSSPPKMTPAMRRKISLAVKAANRRRAAGGGNRVRSVVRRAFASAPARRSSYRRRASGRSSITGSLKSFFGMPMLMKAGGAVGASLLTGYVMRNYGDKLPMSDNQYARAIYIMGIPMAGAYLIRKKSPALAEGLVIGGLVMAINTLMQNLNFGSSAPAPTPAPVGSYGVAGELGSQDFSSYPSSPTIMSETIGATGAFKNAWGN